MACIIMHIMTIFGFMGTLKDIIDFKGVLGATATPSHEIDPNSQVRFHYDDRTKMQWKI